MEPKKNIRVERSRSTFQHIEKMHPYKMLLYMGMIGIAMIFLILVIAFSFNINKASLDETIGLPKIFTLSTFLLMGSSYLVTRAMRAYDDDQIKLLTTSLGAALFLGVTFAILQAFGWWELKSAGVFFDKRPVGTFLYLLTGIHVFHLLVGIILLGFFTFRSFKISRDPIKQLILVTNPFEKLKLELLSVYWHFLGGLWLGLFLYFLFTL